MLFDDLLLILEFDFIIIIGSPPMPLDLINDDEFRPPNCGAPPLLPIEPFASPDGGGGGGVTSGGCCIGGKKVEAMAVVIVDGRVGGTR
jgi:hypothetical protein